MDLLARPAAPRHRGRLSIAQALALGLIQGPTEVLPLSSSGHLVLVPALLGWPYARLPADTRKTFEVALHAGAGLALAGLLRADLRRALSEPLTTAKLALPAAGAGLALEDAIETKGSNPAVTAAAMLAGGLGLLATERYKFVNRGSDPFYVGVAQA